MAMPGSQSLGRHGAAECPSDTDLRDSLEGPLPDMIQARLIEHMDSCHPCRARLQALAASDNLWREAAKNLVECETDFPASLIQLTAMLQAWVGHADETLTPDHSGRPAVLCDSPPPFEWLYCYDLLEVLGRGGMGVVYKALDTRLNRVVAIKVLASPAALRPEARARFQREARAAAAVRSENTVTIYAVEDSAEPPFLVMEYILGRSLQEQIDEGTPMSLDEIRVTVENSLLNLDVDKDFLQAFREKKTNSGYTGLGMLIDCSARLALHTGDPRILELKRQMVKTLIDAQEPDGYLGEFDRAHRLWAFIDIQELAYLIQGLLTDYRLFTEERSLVAARKQADHILHHWGQRPAGWPEKLGMTDHMTNTGVERAIYPFFEYTQD